MGKTPGGRSSGVTMQASGVLGGVEGINIYDQEQYHKEGHADSTLGDSLFREGRNRTEGEGSKQAPRVILPEQGCPAPNDVIKIQAPYQAGGAVNCYHPYTYYQQAVAV